MKKLFLRLIDALLGIPLRSLMRNWVLHPFVRAMYKVTLEGGEDALSCEKTGSIIVARHLSYIDGPLLMSEAWPYVRVRPTAKYAEYYRPMLWPFMLLGGTVCLGSPKTWPREKRESQKKRGIETMNKIIRAGHHLLVFAEGIIGDGERAIIMPHLSGVFELITAHPHKPVLMVNISGLQHSKLGRLKDAPFFSRIPVHITIRRFDSVSLEGGPEGLNKRLEQFFNEGVPLLSQTSHSSV